MTSIVIVFSKTEGARSIKNILVRSGYPVAAVCSTGAQALSHMDGLGGGIVICGYQMPDMLFSQLREDLPADFDMLLIASRNVLKQCEGEVMALAMPLKVHELIDTVGMMVHNIESRRRRRREAPRKRSQEEAVWIREAKELLMERNNMTESEAHRYIQKCSMDSGTNMAETAQMVLSVMRG